MIHWGETYKNDLEEHFLVHLHELLVPLLNVGGLLAGVGLVVLGLGGVVSVVLTPLDDLSKNGLVNLRSSESATSETLG